MGENRARSLFLPVSLLIQTASLPGEGLWAGCVRACEAASVVSDSFPAPWTAAPPGSSVHGILQASILELVATSFTYEAF